MTTAQMTAVLHSTISTTINHFLTYCKLHNGNVKGVLGSNILVLGLCMGVSIVIVLSVYLGDGDLVNAHNIIIIIVSASVLCSDADIISYNYHNNSLIAHYLGQPR